MIKQKTGRSILALLMASALLLTMMIGGLVMPVAAEETNLFANGTFDEGTTIPWRRYNGAAECLTFPEGVGVDGTKCLAITDSAEATTRYNNALLANLEANSVYEFSFDYKTEGACAAQHYADTGTLPTTGYLRSATWAHYSYQFTTGESWNKNTQWESAFIRRQDGTGEGTIYIDNVSLVKKTAATSVTFAQPSLTTGMTRDTGASARQVRAVKQDPVVTPVGAALVAPEWSSSNTEVATVDNKGLVTPVGYGTATITVVSGVYDEFTASYDVVVSPDGELFLNGDFEDDSLAMWYFGGNTTPTFVEDGLTGRGLDITGNNQARYWKGQYFKLDDNSTYTIQYDYKGHYPNFWWNGGTADNQNQNCSTPTTESFALNSEWTRVIKTFTTGENAKLADNFALSIGGYEASTIIDNVSFHKGENAVVYHTVTFLGWDGNSVGTFKVPDGEDATPPTPPAREGFEFTRWIGDYTHVTADVTIRSEYEDVTPYTTNLLVNGDFEDTTADGLSAWNNSAWVQDGVGMNGSRGLLIPATNGQQLYYKGGSLMVEKDFTYVVSFDYTMAGGGNFRVASPQAVLNMDIKPTQVIGGWHHFERVITAPSNAASHINEELSFISASGSGTMAVDNVCIYKIPMRTPHSDLQVISVASDAGIDGVTPGTEVRFSAVVKTAGPDIIYKKNSFRVSFLVDGQEVGSTVSGNANMQPGTTIRYYADQKWTATAGDHTVTAVVHPENWGVVDDDINTVNNNNSKSISLRSAAEALTIPTVAKNAGFTNLTFSDDFASLDVIDRLGSGVEGYKWYVARPWGSGFDYNLMNDSNYELVTYDSGATTALKLADSRSTYNLGLTSQDFRTGAGYAYNHGYMETRFKMPVEADATLTAQGYSGSPAIWSLPTTKMQDTSQEHIEVDFMEYYGYNANRGSEYYSVTYHHSGITDENGKAIAIRNGNYAYDGLGDGEWHTMGFLWQDGVWTNYLDGEQLMRFAYGEGEMPDPGTAIESAFAILEEQYQVLILSGAKRWPLEMDYIRIWQEDDGACHNTALSLDRTELSMYRYEHEQLIATATTADSDPGVLTWTTSDKEIATVHGDGVIHAVGKAGTATITVTDHKGNQATCTVTVEDEGSNLINNGHFESSYLTNWNAASGFLKQGCEIIDSGDPNHGKVLKYTANTGKDPHYKGGTTLLQPNRTYRLSFDYKGSQVQFATQASKFTDIYNWVYSGGSSAGSNYTLATNEWKTFSWTFNTGAEPSLDANWSWYIIRRSAINPTYGDTLLDNFKLVCLDDVGVWTTSEPTALALNTNNAVKTATLTATLDGYSGGYVWASTNTAVATVSDGVVTAVAAGTATITCTAGTEVARFNITVESDPLSGLTINRTALTLNAGTTGTLKVAGNPASAETGEITWTSSDDEIATVEDGVVTAIKKGNVTITASNGTYSVICKVTVTSVGVGEHLVKFYAKDGYTLIDTQIVADGADAVSPEAPNLDNEGYYFVRWSRLITNITKDTSVTAVYDEYAYCVTFVGQDGTTPFARKYTNGAAVEAPAAPAVTGYAFTGWSSNAFESTITQDLTICALYTLNNFTVTFKDWDGTVLKSDTVGYGEAATAPSEPYREGWIFSEWDTDFDYITSDLVVFAAYTMEAKNYITGDVNDDLQVNMKDLALLQQYLAGWDVTVALAAADTDGDTRVNMKDLALLQQYLVGWDVTLA